MIIRIMTEGQYDIADNALDGLNEMDAKLQAAVESGDMPSFRSAFEALLEKVRTSGTKLPDDYLGPSDLVLPAPDTNVEEVRALLSEEGLIPG
jgi:hypothetical protein